MVSLVFKSSGLIKNTMLKGGCLKVRLSSIGNGGTAINNKNNLIFEISFLESPKIF